MRLFQLRARQRLPLSPEAAWAFFSDPANLQEITPPSLSFEITSEVPERMYAGLIVTYRIRALWSIPMTWVTEITHVEAPRYFVDEQRFGPYRFWHHQHHFRRVEGGVELTDIVHYSPPGPGAPLVDRLVVGPRLREIFRYRREFLAERFGELG